MKLQAVCDSEECAFKRMKIGYYKKAGKKYDRIDNKYLGPQIKAVHRDAVDCPDCRSVLIWTKVA